MKSKKINPRLLGFLLLLLMAAGTGIYYGITSGNREPVVVEGYVGGEKIGFIEDPEIQEILEEKYGIRMDYSKAGSLDMVTLNQEGKDYLFPSSQTALEYYREEWGEPRKSEIILNTPIVLYTHRMVADALAEKGIMEEADGVYYMDMEQMAQTIMEGTSWAEVGLPQLYGDVSIDTTDPVKSNSGKYVCGSFGQRVKWGTDRVGRTALPGTPGAHGYFCAAGVYGNLLRGFVQPVLKDGSGSKAYHCRV